QDVADRDGARRRLAEAVDRLIEGVGQREVDRHFAVAAHRDRVDLDLESRTDVRQDVVTEVRLLLRGGEETGRGGRRVRRCSDGAAARRGDRRQCKYGQ